ncbi:hypothetical protein [Chitinophaga vietnamensis]|uniref:hypothetical protein n=1 Tax=Chitinophaga vietnamensis TaxID=2593957 RepID=UPI0011785141|nr:hypothetical protein [Chitinophaga vietnamensis]
MMNFSCFGHQVRFGRDESIQPEVLSLPELIQQLYTKMIRKEQLQRDPETETYRLLHGHQQGAVVLIIDNKVVTDAHCIITVHDNLRVSCFEVKALQQQAFGAA